MVYTTYRDIEQVRQWPAFVEKDTGTYHFCFERISDGKLIGSGDIGFNSAKAIMNYVHENFGARKFAASHCEPNPASGNVMKKCGLHFGGYGTFEKLIVDRINRIIRSVGRGGCHALYFVVNREGK